MDVETPLGSRRKGSVLVLRLVGRQVARVRSSLAPVAMARVARVIAARLGATRPPVPTVLTQIESSRRAAEQLLASPQGLAYRDDGLPPEGWWKVLEGDWPLPHERVGAALALGSTQYLAQRQSAEEVLSSLASGPLRRLTRRAFAAHDAEQADRLLRLALQLGEMRPGRR